MPSPGERQRNNIRTGVFVTASLLLALVIIVALSDGTKSLFSPNRRYIVDYAVLDGVSNLQGGAEVRVGGLEMGRVNNVEPFFEGDRLTSIRVAFDLDPRIALREGAQVYVKASLIGSDAWLEIPVLGDPDGAVIEDRLEGAAPIGLLASMVGAEGAEMTSQILEDVSATAENTRRLTGRIDEDWTGYDERIESMLGNLDLSSAEALALLERIQGEDWPVWSLEINRLLTWTEELSQDLDVTVEEGRLMLTEARDVLDRNGPKLDQIVDNVEISTGQAEQFMTHLNEESLALADAILERAQTGVDAAVSVLSEIDGRKERWSEDISAALVNANLMSTQLKLVAEEVRRSPWKVLHRPTDDELEHELLYAAARSFAVATADLRAAAQSAESILASYGPRLEESAPLRARLEADLIGSLDRYESAQQRLIEVIAGGGAE